MRKYLILFLIFIICFISYGWTKAGWKEDNLKGKVKQRTRVDYNFEKKFGEVVKTIKEKYISKYDAKGNMIEEARYNSDGNLDYKYISKYDAKGNMIEEAGYNNIEEPINFTEYQYEYYQ